MDKEKITLAGFALGSSIVGSFTYIFPKILDIPNWGFGPFLKFMMLLTGLAVGRNLA